MRNYECSPQMDYPHNYAFRIMNYEFISHSRCEKCEISHTFRT